MNKNEGLKKCLIVTMIIAIASVVVTAVCAVLFQMVSDQANMMANFTNQLGLIKDAFVVPFVRDGSSALEKLFVSGSVIPMILGIVVIVLSALSLAAIVAGIVLVVKRKRPAFIAYALVILATLFTSALVVTYEGNQIDVADAPMGYFPTVLGKIQGVVNVDVSKLILAIVILVFALLALVMMIITYVNGIRYAKPETQSLGELAVEEQPVLAEEAVTTEVVEETTEEVFDTTTDDYVPEVEPEPEEIVQEETVIEEEPVEEEPEEKEDDRKVEVNVNNNNAAPAAAAQPAIDTNSLASLLREVVRDIVRDELARNEVNKPQQPQQPQPTGGAQTITGATFGGPLVVQYFNGGINGVTPQGSVAQPVPVQQAQPVAPVATRAVEEKPAKAAPVAEVAAAPEVVAEAPKTEEKVYERISFGERLLKSEKELQDTYSELKNEILSWGVKSRVSAVGDTFRLHKKMYIRITVAGKSLKLYFALDPAEYENSTIPVQDASNKSAYEEIPLVFKVKSALSVRRCKELIQATMEKDGLEQGEVLKVNWIKELKAEMKAGASKKTDED